jgi:hypothetical protein
VIVNLSGPVNAPGTGVNISPGQLANITLRLDLVLTSADTD